MLFFFFPVSFLDLKHIITKCKTFLLFQIKVFLLSTWQRLIHYVVDQFRIIKRSYLARAYLTSVYYCCCRQQPRVLSSRVVTLSINQQFQPLTSSWNEPTSSVSRGECNNRWTTKFNDNTPNILYNSWRKDVAESKLKNHVENVYKDCFIRCQNRFKLQYCQNIIVLLEWS